MSKHETTQGMLHTDTMLSDSMPHDTANIALDYSQNPKGDNLTFHTKQSLFKKVKKRLDKLAKLPSLREEKSGKDLNEVLQEKGIQRRDFMKWAAVVTASIGLPATFAPLTARAAELADRVPIIWLHMAECTGCSESLLRSEDPCIDSIIFVLCKHGIP